MMTADPSALEGLNACVDPDVAASVLHGNSTTQVPGLKSHVTVSGVANAESAKRANIINSPLLINSLRAPKSAFASPKRISMPVLLLRIVLCK
jgi:hypothetical protein